jgi:hypothetical protein
MLSNLQLNLREFSKNIAYFSPIRMVEMLHNYSALRSDVFDLLPKEFMLGKSRYDFYKTIDEQLSSNSPLVFLEFGVYKGQSIKCWCAINQDSHSRFIGFDSFVGLPERWRSRSSGYFSLNGVPPSIDDSRVELIPGFFNQSVPKWLESFEYNNDAKILVHIDSDLYTSALFILTILHKVFGEYWVIFDNYGAGEGRALREYLFAYGAKFEPLLGKKLKKHSKLPQQVFGKLSIMS